MKKVKINGEEYLEIQKPNEEKKTEFSQEEIKLLKSYVDDEEIIEDKEMENLKKLRVKSVKDSIAFGDLFIACYSYFRNNLYLFFTDEQDKLYKKLKKFSSSIQEIAELRDLLEMYGDGEEWGSHYTGERIKDLVSHNKENMESLIQLFFQVFGEEE